MQELSDYEKKTLLKSPCVQKITKNQVVFTAKFKIWAVEQSLKGISPNKIFETKKIPIHFFKEKYCKSCIKRWRKKFQEEGADSFLIDNRGSGKSPGRPRKPTYEELEAIVAIQREVLGYAKK